MSFVLKGRRILVDKPMLPKSSIELSPAQQAELESTLIDKFKKLRIHAVGDDCKFAKPDMVVHITFRDIEHAIPIDLDGVINLMLDESDIAIIYN